MPEIVWIKIKDQLPPVDENVLTLHSGVKQTFGGALLKGFVSGDDMAVLYLDKSGSFYPGGLGAGWISHWAHLPAKPEDLEIMDLG